MQFIHRIKFPEVNAHYINLTDDLGNRHGTKIGKHNAIFTVIDENGRKTKMKRYRGNQLTCCSEWYKRKNIRPSWT